ncbi:MAG: NF038104 family lipoprotein [Psychrobium sp.]
MLKTLVQSLSILFLLLSLSGCIAASIVSGAVDITTTAVGGAIDVVDAVTPDILDDDDDEKEESDEEKQ